MDETVGGLTIRQLSDRWRNLVKSGHVLKDKIAVKNTRECQ